MSNQLKMASLRRKIALSVAALGLFGTAVMAMVVLTVHSGFGRGDCGESPPFVSPKYPGQSVFVAKILYVSGDSQPSDKHIPWSIAVVEHRYWGLPWWVPNFVLIGHSGPFLKKGAEYFIDGDRTMARVSSFFSVYRVSLRKPNCSGERRRGRFAGFARRATEIGSPHHRPLSTSILRRQIPARRRGDSKNHRTRGGSLGN